MERRVALGDSPFDPYSFNDNSAQALVREAHKGGYTRGYLPHIDLPVVQFITFRLSGSFPTALLRTLKQELKALDKEELRRELYRRTESIVDSGYGTCWLAQPEFAKIVQEQLLFHDGDRYQLHAWTIMPNHVHLLAKINEGWSLPKIVQTWKARSAKRANEILQRNGAFWYRDYFDRYIRSEAHFGNCERYIDSNPVKAGLCQSPEEWPWGSARLRNGATLSPSATQRSISDGPTHD